MVFDLLLAMCTASVVMFDLLAIQYVKPRLWIQLAGNVVCKASAVVFDLLAMCTASVVVVDYWR